MTKDPRRLFGDLGEDIAAKYLIKMGFEIIESQKRTESGEIDLVCKDGDEYIFVEVKSRKSDKFGFPEASITSAKFQKMVKSAEEYLIENKLEGNRWRIDVIAIRVFTEKEPEITHFPSVDMPCQF